MIPGNMENPWGFLSKHYLLICSNTNACDWHFRVVGGEPSSNFGCEITILTAFFIVFCSSCRKILCWYIRMYQIVPQVHHPKSSYHGSFITTKLKKFIQHNKIPEYANRSTEDQLHSSAFLCWYFIFFMLMFHFYLG